MFNSLVLLVNLKTHIVAALETSVTQIANVSTCEAFNMWAKTLSTTTSSTGDATTADSIGNAKRPHLYWKNTWILKGIPQLVQGICIHAQLFTSLTIYEHFLQNTLFFSLYFSARESQTRLPYKLISAVSFASVL